MPESQIPSASIVPTTDRLPYQAPELKHHGDVETLTQAEYGDLDSVTHGLLFAMTSPDFAPLPDAPIR